MSMKENESKIFNLQDVVVALVSISEDVVSKEEFQRIDDKGAEIINCLSELKSYRAIGTIDEFKSLKEKNVAKKAIRRTGMCYSKAKDGTEDYEIIEECPTCKKRLCAVSFNVGYCKCGQRITI